MGSCLVQLLERIHSSITYERAPSAEPEAMTAPRAREQRRPPPPPDRRGGGSSPSAYAASAAGRPASSARPRVARRGLVRSARALAAAALLALSGALAPPAQAQACTLNTGDLWCGVVTVGVFLDPPVAYGFFEEEEVGDLVGTPADEMFSVDGNQYTITAVVVASTDASLGALSFALGAALSEAARAKLVLHVDGTSTPFAFASSTIFMTSTYQWLNAGLDWSSASTVTLRLRAPVTNNPPVFSDGAMTTLSVAENSAVGTDVGAPVTATDADSGDTLTYTLEGTDAASFTIDSGTGQIETVSGGDLQPRGDAEQLLGDGEGRRRQ